MNFECEYTKDGEQSSTILCFECMEDEALLEAYPELEVNEKTTSRCAECGD